MRGMNKNNAQLGGLALIVLILFVAAISLKTDTKNDQNNYPVKPEDFVQQKQTSALPILPDREAEEKNNFIAQKITGDILPDKRKKTDAGNQETMTQNSGMAQSPETPSTIQNPNPEEALRYFSIFSAPFLNLLATESNPVSNETTSEQKSETNTAIGEDCGGGTAPKPGIGPSFWTPTCLACYFACAPYAYLWDSITEICGCAK